MTSDLARLPRHPGAGGVHRLELLHALRGFALCSIPMIDPRSLAPFEFATLAIALLALLFGTDFAMQAGQPGDKPGALRLLARRMLRESVAYRHYWVRLLVATLAFGLVAAALPMSTGTGSNVGMRLRELLPLAQGLFCTAAFVLLFQQPRWRRWLRKLAPMGRMALTNGLVQAAIGLSLFYGSGPRLDLEGLVMFGAAISVLQAVFSCWWLARPRFGPLMRTLRAGP